jgi:hypothetical protein
MLAAAHDAAEVGFTAAPIGTLPILALEPMDCRSSFRHLAFDLCRQVSSDVRSASTVTSRLAGHCAGVLAAARPDVQMPRLP